jgi:hypothetical protein
MKPSVVGHHTPTPLGWSAVRRTVRLSIFGFIGWFWFLKENDSVEKAVPLVVALVLAGLVGITWYAFRARADRRWRRALDRYGEKEEARSGLSRGTPQARPHWKDRPTTRGAEH